MGRTIAPDLSNAKAKLDKTGGVQRVEEKLNDPAAKPRFTRNAAVADGAGKADHTTAGPKLSNEAELCQQLLVDGYVQSYVDFYHLTHRADPNAAEGRVVSKIHTALEDMIFIRDNLVLAEQNRRSGNTSGVYTAYNKLADMYMRHSDWKTSIFFHEKCLEVAQLTADMRAEMAANHALGVVYQRMDDFDQARKHHEKHEAIASSIDLQEEVAKANVELYKVYMVLAAKLDNVVEPSKPATPSAAGSSSSGGRSRGSTPRGSMSNISGALEMYQKCLAAAVKCWDKASEGEANGKIGNLYLKNGMPNESLQYLRQHSQISADLGDAESRCRACSALALALDTLGLADKALVELKLVHSISEQAGDAILQSQACRALGTLYSKVGKLEDAVAVLQRHFDLLKSLAAKDKTTAGAAGGMSKTGSNGKKQAYVGPLVKAKDLDLARAFVGISKGNLLVGAYMYTIECDLSSLLEWKLTRAELPQPPPSALDSPAVSRERHA